MKNKYFLVVFLLVAIFSLLLIGCATPSSDYSICGAKDLHVLQGSSQSVLLDGVDVVFEDGSQSVKPNLSTIDLSSSGQKELTYTYGDKSVTVSVYVYGQIQATYSDQAMPDVINLTYPDALSSSNFTTGVKVVDSFGKELTVTKTESSQDFNRKPGEYVVTYLAEDEVGQAFSKTVTYKVVNQKDIIVTPKSAYSTDSGVFLPAELNGVQNAWLEDSFGRVNANYYEILEDKIYIDGKYFKNFPSGARTLGIYSNQGQNDFNLDIKEELGGLDIMSYVANVFTTHPTKPNLATFRVGNSTENTTYGFDYSYYYKKPINKREDETALFVNAGNITKIKMKVFLKSATDNVINWKITAGKFLSVKDEEGSIVTINQGAYPSAPMTAGKTYTVELDLLDVARFSIHVSYSKACDIYYSDFEFTEGQGIFLSRTLVYKNVSSENAYIEGKSYFAWPTVTYIDNGRLLAVCSGYRSAHVSPDGRLVGFISNDDGKTWSDPFVIVDSPLDDRDAGVIYWKNKIIVTWFTHGKDYNSTYRAHWDSLGLDDSVEDEWVGGNSIEGSIGANGEITWSNHQRIRMFSPHGIITDGEDLYYVGYIDYDKVNCGFNNGIGVSKSTDGRTWSEPKVILTNSEVKAKSFNEPNGVFNSNGDLIVMIRSEFAGNAGKGMYQCVSTDKGQTFSDLVYTVDSPCTPPHLFRANDGTIVLTYGTRGTVATYNKNNANGYGLIAQLSYDNGKTWSQKYMLSTGSALTSGTYASGDIGYSSTTQKSDGTLITVYYSKDCSNDSFTCLFSVTWTMPEKEAKPTVKFDLDGGVGVESIRGYFGADMQKPQNPTKEGHAFIGWYDSKDFTVPFNFSKFYTSRTVYAKWVALDVELKGPASYVRKAENTDFTGVGKEFNEKSWIYTKPSGTAGGPGKTAEAYMSVDSSVMKSLTFSVYVKSYSYTGGTTPCHIEIDGVGANVSVKDSNGTPIELTDNVTDNVIKGQTAYIEVGEWYTVTVEVIEGATKVYPFSWTKANVTMLFTDITVTPR